MRWRERVLQIEHFANQEQHTAALRLFEANYDGLARLLALVRLVTDTPEDPKIESLVEGVYLDLLLCRAQAQADAKGIMQ